MLFEIIKCYPDEGYPEGEDLQAAPSGVGVTVHSGWAIALRNSSLQHTRPVGPVGTCPLWPAPALLGSVSWALDTGWGHVELGPSRVASSEEGAQGSPVQMTQAT